MKDVEKTLKVKRGSAGLGLFATTDLKKGVRLTEYRGEHISDAEADRRGGKYLFTLRKNVVIDGKDRSNLARYINHSCKPNCYAEISYDEKHIYYFTKRSIKAGEELTIDYGKEYFDDIIKPIGCKCTVCVGT